MPPANQKQALRISCPAPVIVGRTIARWRGLRDGSAAVTRIGFLDVGGAGAGSRLQQFLQEGGLAAARRGFARFERDDMAILQAIMANGGDLVVLVEIDRQ